VSVDRCPLIGVRWSGRDGRWRRCSGPASPRPFQIVGAPDTVVATHPLSVSGVTWEVCVVRQTCRAVDGRIGVRRPVTGLTGGTDMARNWPSISVWNGRVPTSWRWPAKSDPVTRHPATALPGGATCTTLSPSVDLLSLTIPGSGRRYPGFPAFLSAVSFLPAVRCLSNIRQLCVPSPTICSIANLKGATS